MSTKPFKSKSYRAWLHNSLLGGVHMSRKNMDLIIRSDTTTEEAKKQAFRVFLELEALLPLLKTRMDPP